VPSKGSLCLPLPLARREKGNEQDTPTAAAEEGRLVFMITRRGIERRASRTSSRVASPAVGRTPVAPLLSLRADGPIVGGLYTPLLLVAAALHNTDEHQQSAQS